MSGECDKCSEHTLQCTCETGCRRREGAWISIKDRLPPKDGTPFLGYDPKKEDSGKIYVLIYIPEKKYTGEFVKLSHEEYYQEASGEGYFIWEPTYWMPLPDRPKE